MLLISYPNASREKVTFYIVLQPELVLKGILITSTSDLVILNVFNMDINQLHYF